MTLTAPLDYRNPISSATSCAFEQFWEPESEKIVAATTPDKHHLSWNLDRRALVSGDHAECYRRWNKYLYESGEMFRLRPSVDNIQDPNVQNAVNANKTAHIWSNNAQV